MGIEPATSENSKNAPQTTRLTGFYFSQNLVLYIQFRLQLPNTDDYITASSSTTLNSQPTPSTTATAPTTATRTTSSIGTTTTNANNGPGLKRKAATTMTGPNDQTTRFVSLDKSFFFLYS